MAFAGEALGGKMARGDRNSVGGRVSRWFVHCRGAGGMAGTRDVLLRPGPVLRAVVRGSGTHMTSGWKVTVELSSVSESSTMKRCGFFLRMVSSPAGSAIVESVVIISIGPCGRAPGEEEKGQSSSCLEEIPIQEECVLLLSCSLRWPWCACPPVAVRSSPSFFSRPRSTPPQSPAPAPYLHHPHQSHTHTPHTPSSPTSPTSHTWHLHHLVNLSQ